LQTRPLLRTSTGRNTIAFLGLVTFWHIPNVTTIDWQANDPRAIWRSNYETRVAECAWWDNYGRGVSPRYGAPPACKTPLVLNKPKALIRGGGMFFNFVSDVDVCLTGAEYRHLLITSPSQWHSAPGAPPAARARFYGMNLEHAMGEANAEVFQSRQGVDVFGLKIEGSNVIFWVRDSDDFNLWGLGGASDAFPLANGTAYYPPAFAKYPASLFRVERTPHYRFVITLNAGRTGGYRVPPVTPIGVGLIDDDMLRSMGLRFSDIQIKEMVRTMWAPWPGYAVSKELWVQHAECHSLNACNLSRPFERPIMLARGHNFTIPASYVFV